MAGEADQVGEQHGDDPPLLAPGHPQAVATARTEAGALRKRRAHDGQTNIRVPAYGNRPPLRRWPEAVAAASRLGPCRAASDDVEHDRSSLP